MKGLGFVLIAVGVLLFIGAIFSVVIDRSAEKAPVKPNPLEVTSENGESMAILPLLAVVSLATGGALVVASHITRKGA